MSLARMEAKRALFREDAIALAELAERGWSVDEPDAAGSSLLWYAAADGRWEQARLLLALGGDPGAALEGFLTQGEPDAERARELAGRMRSVNAPLRRGRRALNLACRRGLAETIGALLEAGADANAEDAMGVTPLGELPRRFHAGAAAALLAAGARVDHVSAKGQSLAHHAVYWDAPKALEWLVASGAPMDLSNRWGETPLERAVQLGRLDCARRLIAAGADVNRPGSRGKTPLYWAVARGLEDLARELIEAGADPERKSGKNGQGRSALSLARRGRGGGSRVASASLMEARVLESVARPAEGDRGARAKSL